MDKFITSEATHGLNPHSKFFEPLKPTRKPPPTTLSFHLIISDPASDSSLTPNWSVPEALLHVPATTTISGFFSHLREKLPVASGRTSSVFTSPSRRGLVDSPSPSYTNSSSSGSSNSHNNSRNIPLNRRPKLGSAKLFLMNGRNGLVVPMVKDDREWDFRHGYARVDLMDKTEAEWRFFKELMMAADGEFKCYVAIAPAKSREFPWGRGFFGRKG